MIDLKAFRKANGLTQADVAQYLSVSAPFITRVETGSNKLPEDKLQKLINNDRGWDTTMLISVEHSGDNIHQNGGSHNIGKVTCEVSEIAALKRENIMLRQQVEDLKEQNEKYWNMIEKLTEK